MAEAASSCKAFCSGVEVAASFLQDCCRGLDRQNRVSQFFDTTIVLSLRIVLLI